MAYATIVVGYDETDAASRALARAADLAEKFGSTVVVASIASLRVTPPNPIGGVLPGLDPAERFAFETVNELDEADHHLAAARAYLGGRGIEPELVTDVGGPGERIVALAEERNADLIVVGSHAHGFLDRFFAVSVTDDVVRQTSCDVLLVH